MGDSKGAKPSLAVTPEGSKSPVSQGVGSCPVVISTLDGPVTYVQVKKIRTKTNKRDKSFEIKRHYPKVSKELDKATNCKRYIYVYCCPKCGEKREVRAPCNSRMCLKCWQRLHNTRAKRAYEILEPYLDKWYSWSKYVLTIPQEIRYRIDSWEEILKLRREAYSIVKEKTRGFGGLVSIHLAGDRDLSVWHPHVEVIIGGRGFHEWKDIEQAWAVFLHKEYGYVGQTNVHEVHFLKGGESRDYRRDILWHKVFYGVRLPEPIPETYRHYELLIGKQQYHYFGEVVTDFREQTEEEEDNVEICSNCGAEMSIVGCWDSKDMLQSWFMEDGLDYLVAKNPEIWGGICTEYGGIKLKRQLMFQGN